MSVVAIGCEIVSTGKKNLLAKVTIVDQDYNVLLDEYVKPNARVTGCRTHISRITKRKLHKGKSFHDVKSRVSKLIRGKILVGHSVQLYLAVLELKHPEDKCRDLAKYEPYMENDQPRSLQALAAKYLNKRIPKGEHNSMRDAETAMQLYERVARFW